MDRSQKTELVSSMREKLCDSSIVVVAHQSGLTVGESTELRRKVREASAEFKILKNTLGQIAVRETHLSGLADLMKGPTALAYSKDPIAAAKAVVQFAKKNDRLKVVGGYFDGKMMDAKGIQALADVPTLDESRAQILRLLMAPATQIALVTKTAMEKWTAEQQTA